MLRWERSAIETGGQQYFVAQRLVDADGSSEAELLTVAFHSIQSGEFHIASFLCHTYHPEKISQQQTGPLTGACRLGSPGELAWQRAKRQELVTPKSGAYQGGGDLPARKGAS